MNVSIKDHLTVDMLRHAFSCKVAKLSNTHSLSFERGFMSKRRGCRAPPASSDSGPCGSVSLCSLALKTSPVYMNLLSLSVPHASSSSWPTPCPTKKQRCLPLWFLRNEVSELTKTCLFDKPLAHSSGFRSMQP